MSMDVSFRLLLCSLLTAYTQAGPLSTVSLSSLTPYLVQNVPICAQPCLQQFVTDNFPSSVCSSPSIDCLCTSDSETGYTIGEGTLGCLESDCPGWDGDEAVSAYEICSNVAGAMPNTHSTITASNTAVTTASATTSPTLTSSTSHSTSILSSSSQVSASSSSSASASASSTNNFITTNTSAPSSSITQPPSSIIAPPASASSAPPPKPTLSKPQIAGIVVASVAAAILAVGLCLLLFCCRRRKQIRRRSVSSFGGDKVVGSSANSSPDLATLGARDWGHDAEGIEVVAESGEALPPRLSVTTPRTTGEGGWSQYRRNTAPQDIGLALAPGALTTERSSPITPSSRRTRNSQLLPDKPSYSLFPLPTRPSPHSMRASQSLEALLASRNMPGRMPSPPPVSNPKFPSSLDTSQSYMQGDPSSRSPSSPPGPPQIFPYMQTSRAQAGYQPYRTAPAPGLPASPRPTRPSSKVVREPLSARASQSVRGSRLGKSIHSQYNSNPRPYAPPPPPIDPQHSSNASIKSPRRQKSDSRPPTWLSTGSETSFEDADADDFPEPVSALTPVKEQHSPVTYPRIPTTAAESPTRRPQIPQRSDSLLARRRGAERVTTLWHGIQSPSSPPAVRYSAKSQILQSPVLSEPLGTDSSSSNSPRRTGKGAGTKPPPSGWPVTR